MIGLIKKDFAFSTKWLCIALVYCVVMSYIMYQGDGAQMFFVNFLIPFLVVMFPLGKLMSMEDNRDTREFLKRMPYSSRERVGAKAIFIFSLLLISFICVNVAGCHLGVFEFSGSLVEDSVIELLLFMIYFLLQLAIFYYKSYHVAQNTISILLMFAILVTYIFENYNISISMSGISKIVIVVGLIIINIFMFEIACICEKKNN